jgi:hypothetical protein
MAEYPKAEKAQVERPDLDNGRRPSLRWWRLPYEKGPNPTLAREIWGVKNEIASAQMDRIGDLDMYSMMYRGEDVEQFLAALGVRLVGPGQSPASHNNLGPMLNISKSAVDTVNARVAADKPKVAFLTEGGNWKQKQKAKKLEKLIAGLFYEWDIYHRAPDTSKDSLTWGTGAFKVFEEDRRVKIERTIIPELMVDEGDGRYGDPRQLLHRRWMPQDVLASLFDEDPVVLDLIQSAELVTEDVSRSRSIVDVIEVLEIWHRPSLPGRKDGRHVICMQNCVLLDENDWDEPSFPYAFLHYDKNQVGFWGMGLIEAGRTIQADVNRTERRSSEILRRCTNTRVYLERGSRVVKSQWGNTIGQIIEYTGRQPMIDSQNRVPTELFQRTDVKTNQYFAIAGVSQMSAQGQIPNVLGPNASGKAIRAFDDVGSMRFQVFANNYQHMFLDIARLALRLIRKIVERDGTYPVNVPARGFMEVVDAADILDIDDEEFLMKMWPVNLLPDSPAEKLQTATEMKQDGSITQDVFNSLMDFPDVQSAMGPINAPRELLEKQMDQMLDKGEAVTPEWDTQDPQYCLTNAVLYIQKAQVDGCPEEHLNLARNYLSECKAELQIRQQAAQQAAMAAQAAAAPPSAKGPPLPVNQAIPAGQIGPGMAA